MTSFDPHAELDLDPGASEAEVREAYRRRLLETDPSRVVGMDERIQVAAREARRRVEVAQRLLTAPDSVSPAEIPGPEGAAAPAPGPERKSYVKALLLTLVVPGAGSGYGGGRRRGVTVMAVMTVLVLLGIRSVQAAQAALAPGAGIQAQLRTLEELSPWVSSAYLVAFVDALLAVWAHNDRVETGRA